MIDPIAATRPHSRTVDRVAVCRQCDWLMRLPARQPAQGAVCPRCHHHVAARAQHSLDWPLAWSLATLLMLAFVFAFNFLGFSSHGVGHTMHFTDAAGALFGYGYPSLALLLLATTVVLPGVYLLVVVFVCLGARGYGYRPGVIAVARTVRCIEPWLMSDVFIVGVLVSLTKIVTLADIHLSLSFVIFCIYSLMLLYTCTLIDWTTLWDALVPPSSSESIACGTVARRQHVIACRGCDTPFKAATTRCCPRCGKRHAAWFGRLDRTQLTLALLSASAILYIPANVYPVLSTTQLGRTEPQTIIAGVIHLARSGSWPIALVILLASVCVPISKVLALGWLCLASRARQNGVAYVRTRVFRVVEKIGRWSMIDVFVVAILCALVQTGQLMTITPGPGALAFATVVVLTMLAALSFDTRILWPDGP